MDYKNIYILGIGGSGMSSIGKYLKQKGLNVIGYDQRKSYITNLLKQDGINVEFSEIEIFSNVLKASSVSKIIGWSESP